LLKYIEENGKYVEITGFRGVKIKNTEEFLKTIRGGKQPDVIIQFFDAQLVATWQHLYFAVVNAITAFKNMENISKNLEMETMLYASAQRQIQKAIETMGIKHNSSNIAVVIVSKKPENSRKALLKISKHLRAQPDESVLELSKRKMKTVQKAFGISDRELQTVKKKDNFERALTDLVIERAALLSTNL